MIPVHVVDAFTTRPFGGNPAAVVPLDRYPADAWLQAVAAEHNLSETAFIVPRGNDWELRWFTPEVEVPLCGHATLASAWVVLNRLQPDRDRVTFHTRQRGALHIERRSDAYAMDFPADLPQPANIDLRPVLGFAPVAVFEASTRYLAVLETAAQVRTLQPDLIALRQLTGLDLLVTAPGDEDFDMVSRFFAPAKGIDEDPVTGSAHCVLAPYWSARLGKSELRAWQASERGGGMICRMKGDRVELEGACVPYSTGHILLDLP